MKVNPELQKLQKHKIRAYRWLYEFTKSACGDCAGTDCACKDSICSHVEEQARKDGFSFTRTGHRLRFIGCDGCIVPPHLRETCTIYLCERAQSKPGFRRRRYEKLKSHCQRIELAIMEAAGAET